MRRCKYPIDESTFNSLKGKPRVELNDYCEANFPAYILYGYGFYGAIGVFKDENGGYYIDYVEGESCD